jgi:hypothetical protein
MAGRRRFKKPGDIRRYLASVLNRIESDELDPVTGGKCAYISGILLNCIRDNDIEERIAKLEKEISK